jgi:hypothetical protein
MAPFVLPEITVRNKVPSVYIHVTALVIHIQRNSGKSHIFRISCLKKRLLVEYVRYDRFPYVSLETFVSNKVPSKNFLTGTLFLTDIPRGT